MEQIHREANAGTLDPSFGDAGVVDFSNEAGIPYDTLALPDGKLLYADLMPNSSYVIRLRRLNANGFVDSGFGGKGWVEVPAGTREITYVKLSAYREEGWLLTWNSLLQADNADVFVVRLDMDGQPVPSFGENGQVTFNPYDLFHGTQQPSRQLSVKRDDGRERRQLSPWDDYFLPLDVSVQADGRIVLGYGLVPIAERGMLIRLNSDGSFDKTFNDVGFVSVDLAGVNYVHNVVRRVIVLKDGKILLIGEYYITSLPMSIFVTRYNENGHVDSNFNNGHVVTIAHPDFRDCMPDAFAVRESDGAIVVVGYASPEAPFSERTGLIAVLNASGSFNLAFNGGKTLISRLLEEGSRWEACAWQKDGQAIILGGSGGEGRIDSNRSVLTARYLFDGTLDQSFNGQGWAVYKHPRGNASYEGMTMTLDNKLVICSHVYTSGIRRGCVLRYLT